MKNNNKSIYDFIGIGIGPFNLGLAALSKPVAGCKTLFFDRRNEFNWHAGLMLDDATLQVPFMADLVTMADPTSPYSFLNFMKETGRIYKFYIRENFFILRKEYNAYCKWVISRLDNCLFAREVIDICYTNALYQVTVRNHKTKEESTYFCRKLVLGTGTVPYMPPTIRRQNLPKVIHTSAYLDHRNDLLKERSVTVIGSGQSAAEIVRDLLPFTRKGLHVNWITRSDRFFPLENHARLTLEMTSPEYVDYFYGLSTPKRAQLLAKQPILYKGVNYGLINEIFDTLYTLEVADGKVNVTLIANSELQELTAGTSGSYTLTFLQQEQNKLYQLNTGFVVMATGYKYEEPSFLKGIAERLKRNTTGNLAVARNYTVDKNQHEIYVQNAELQTHGFVTPDLGMGAYRNSYILNELMGKVIYPVEAKIAFQTFGVEDLPDQFANKNVEMVGDAGYVASAIERLS
ncbi:lysine N(6)-hydroxylase/L-ornithine N(5)-oxygenase family protein [Olivibacter jilunii]|uniref:lysine N(6)-hydroxylase/L-ornithine N(5)-oxygenase family protein n=1 Tax=Olivibacter jilunii TaxID=985016 RepID=UPI003F174665